MASPGKGFVLPENWRDTLMKSPVLTEHMIDAIRYSVPSMLVSKDRFKDMPFFWDAPMAKVLDLPTGYEGNPSYGTW